MSKHSSDDNPLGNDFLKDVLAKNNKSRSSKFADVESNVDSANTVDTSADNVSNADNASTIDADNKELNDVKDSGNMQEVNIVDDYNDKTPESIESDKETLDSQKEDIASILAKKKAANIPDFKAHKVSKKKDAVSVETEFDKVKPHEETKNKGTEVLDRERRRKWYVKLMLSILALFALVFLGMVAYDVIMQGKKPDTPIIEQIEEDKTKITETPQEPIMYQIAKSHNPDFLDLVTEGRKDVFVNKDAVTIHNSENSVVTTFSQYMFNNDNHCTTNKDTDFCYVAELVRDEDGTMAASLYGFDNIFQNQFFNEFSEPVEETVPGFDYAATANVTVAGEDSYVILLANESGLGYGFVAYGQEERDAILADMQIIE